ncbi:MAG TPA: DUF192 domain-containing protein [Ilumatobacter sp.]|nr:DUF192 domain-containing protein [Ilumatobacter sp.]
MRRSLVPVLLASLTIGACSGESDAVPMTTTVAPAPSIPPSSPAPTTDATSDTVTPEGFERVRATVTEPDGTVCELCLWLADTGDRRRRGLMSVTGLGDADGMAFVYPTLHSGNFWMKNTLLPLSIAFFGIGGTYLDAFDMDPCTEDPCGLYRTPDDFLIAIETTQGDLADLGIGPGSVLDLTEISCDR